MKITGSRNYIKFDLENGYVLTAKGEMLMGKTFVVYKDTMKSWDPPQDKEEITSKQIEDIISEVKKNTNIHTVQILFE